MKIAIVSPPFPFSGKVPLVPPILEYLAALTFRFDPSIEIEMIDANQSEVDIDELNADMVAVSVMTATVPWAYAFADSCRARGLKIVLGGIHPTALPEEAAQHADSVVVGEAESEWGTLLSDLRLGNLKKYYRGKRLPLENLPTPINGKLKGNYRFRAFFTMRGCPYRCTFCSVRRFFGDTIRYRPIDEAVNEIEARAGRVWFNGDDNIWGGDIARSIALFERLASGSHKHWYGFGDLKAIQGQDGNRLLKAARKSGLFSVWVGWESDEQNTLKIYNATGKQGSDRISAIRKMQDAGIDVVLFVVLGGRADDITSFQKTLDLADELKVGIHPVLLTPLPGTELFEEYRQYLLPDIGWEHFTGARAIFAHPNPEMTPIKREEEFYKLSREIYRPGRIAQRLLRIGSSGFPATHLLSLMKQIPMRRALNKAYEDWLQFDKDET